MRICPVAPLKRGVLQSKPYGKTLEQSPHIEWLTSNGYGGKF